MKRKATSLPNPEKKTKTDGYSYTDIPSDLTLIINSAEFYLHSSLGLISSWFASYVKTNSDDPSQTLSFPNFSQADIHSFFTALYAFWKHDPLPLSDEASERCRLAVLAAYFGVDKFLDTLHLSELILKTEEKGYWHLIQNLPRPWDVPISNAVLRRATEFVSVTQPDLALFPKALHPRMQCLTQLSVSWCAICTETLKNSPRSPLFKKPRKNNNKQNSIVFGKCSHAFHDRCLLSWQKRHQFCPLCDMVWVLAETFL